MVILLILLILSNFTIPYVSASDTTYYARIMQEDVMFFRSPIDVQDVSNVYFALPKTYFVELISSPNEEFYQARYMDTVGYVKKDCVQAVSSTPIKPYQTGYTFRVYAEMSEEIRSSPTDDVNNHVTSIPHLTSNIIYIGKIKGDALIEDRTDTWYYCRYIGDQVYDGYVYSDFCDRLNTLMPNTEDVTYIPNPTFEKETPTSDHLKMNNSLVGILIGILSIPALIFVFMLLKSKQILSNDASKSEVKDYYSKLDL